MGNDHHVFTEIKNCDDDDKFIDFDLVFNNKISIRYKSYGKISGGIEELIDQYDDEKFVRFLLTRFYYYHQLTIFENHIYCDDLV